MVNEADVITILITQELRDQAVSFSMRKLGFTVDTWQERNVGNRDADIVMGDIAKESLKQYLRGRNIEVEDYDEIRDDEFRNPAPWNLRIIDENGRRTIEIKSSLDRYIPQLDRLIDEFNMLAYPDQQRNLIVQVYFIRGFSVNDNCYLIGWLPWNEIAIPGNLGRLPHHPYHVDYHIEPLRNTRALGELH